MSLSFDELRRANVARCEDVFHPLLSWSPAEWSNAMAGEVGEACNVTKKMLRGDYAAASVDPITILAYELADVLIYADLLAARCGIDLGEAVRQKFNAVSRKRGSEILL